MVASLPSQRKAIYKGPVTTQEQKDTFWENGCLLNNGQRTQNSGKEDGHLGLLARYVSVY